MIKISTSFILGGLLYIFLLSYDDCIRSRHILKEPGIVLTFDDCSIHEWLSILPLLDSFNVDVTFFLTDIASIGPDELIILRNIQESGHEIASHGYAHVDPIIHIKEKGTLDYINSEILPAKDFLINQGFCQKSFAYVHGIRSKKLDFEMASIFQNIRAVSETQRHKRLKSIQNIEDLYFDRECQRIVHALCIDEIQNINIDQINYIFKKIVRENKIIVFYAHTPKIITSNGKWEINVDFLIEIFKIATKMNIKFLKFKDINHV